MLVARDNFAQAGQPILDELTRTFNETTYLAVRRDLDFQYRAKADCTQAMRYVIDIGYVGPLYAGAAGRAILSAMSEDDLRATLKLIKLEQLTSATITDPERLIEDAARHREMGYVYTSGERTAGVTAYAVPFFDALGRCRGAVVLSQPADRHTDQTHIAIVAAMIKAAQQMTVRIGGLPTNHPRLRPESD
jgi:IclR family acetate operon transcriptional repressor